MKYLNPLRHQLLSCVLVRQTGSYLIFEALNAKDAQILVLNTPSVDEQEKAANEFYEPRIHDAHSKPSLGYQAFMEGIHWLRKWQYQRQKGQMK